MSIQSHSFRNSVVSSTFTLPTMAVIVLLVWVLSDVTDVNLWGGLAVTELTAYLIMELNNRNALLRIRSRMMSVTYLALMLVCPALHTWSMEAIPTVCFVLAYFMLFSSYQQFRAEGYIFHAFLLLGIGSMVFPPMLVLAIAYYISMLFQLRSLTWRTFMAGLFGLAVPYWILAAYAIWNNQLDTAFLYLNDWFVPHVPDYSLLKLDQWITVGIFFALALFAFVHFIHTAYNDKIRTRMLLYTVITMQVFLTVGLLLLPEHFDKQMRLFIANSSLIIAHYYALGKGRLFNTWFNLTVLILIVLGVYNYYVQMG